MLWGLSLDPPRAIVAEEWDSNTDKGVGGSLLLSSTLLRASCHMAGSVVPTDMQC